MQYCTAPQNIDGTAVVTVTLPLDVVSLFDPRNPPPHCFGCDDAVQVGWEMTSQTHSLTWTPPGEKDAIEITVPVFQPPSPPTPTTEQLVSAGQQAGQAAMDAIAQTRGYESMASLCSYAGGVTGLIGDALKFQQEGNAGYTYRSQVWSKLFSLASSSPANGVTTIAEAQQAAIAAMPDFTWPDGSTVSPMLPTNKATPSMQQGAA